TRAPRCDGVGGVGSVTAVDLPCCAEYFLLQSVWHRITLRAHTTPANDQLPETAPRSLRHGAHMGPRLGRGWYSRGRGQPAASIPPLVGRLLPRLRRTPPGPGDSRLRGRHHLRRRTRSRRAT